jgi:hypothetical protein
MFILAPLLLLRDGAVWNILLSIEGIKALMARRLRAGQRFHVLEPIGQDRNKERYYRVEIHVEEEAC